MKVQIVLTNKFGNYPGEILDVTPEQYKKIIDMSKNYYESGFEMTSEDGGFIIFSPELVKKSILKVNIIST